MPACGLRQEKRGPDIRLQTIIAGWGGYSCKVANHPLQEYAIGSRVITFKQNQGGAAFAITTHVRMANGSVIHKGTLA